MSQLYNLTDNKLSLQYQRLEGKLNKAFILRIFQMERNLKWTRGLSLWPIILYVNILGERKSVKQDYLFSYPPLVVTHSSVCDFQILGSY